MSIEDRVRAATRARTDLVRDIRPLGLPDELPARGRRSRHPRPARDPRRWLTWGAPIAAAALVTAVALALVLLRQAPAPSPAPAPAASAMAAIPRYYVAVVNDNTGTRSAPWTKAVVGDDQTGRVVAVLNPAAGQNFYSVTGGADDDRTFVVQNFANSTQLTTWYLLRLTPGAARPAQLTKLPIKPERAFPQDSALSPDGRELAVVWGNYANQTPVISLVVYSMSSGAVLHTWSTKGSFSQDQMTGWASGAALAWVDGGRKLNFQWVVTIAGAGGAPRSWTDTVRTIDVTAPGGDLLADSRVAVQVQLVVATGKTRTRYSGPCDGEVTAGDGTVVCGTSVGNVSSEEVCSTVPLSFVTYSGTTGKRLKVLGQWPGQCLQARAMPVWTDSDGRHVIAFLIRSEKGKKLPTYQFGLIADGKFTSLPELGAGNAEYLIRDRLAF